MSQILEFLTANAWVVPLVVSTALVTAPISLVILEALRAMAIESALFAVGLVIEDKQINNEYALNVLVRYLNKHGRAFGINKETFVAEKKQVKAAERHRAVFSRDLQNSWRFFIYRGRPILLRPYTSSEFSNRSGGFHFLRWTVNWNQLLNDAAKYEDACNDQKGLQRKFKVTRFTGSPYGMAHKNETKSGRYGSAHAAEPYDDAPNATETVNYTEDELGIPHFDDPLAHLSMTPAMERVLKDAKFWYTHRDWYKEREVVWRRGYLLHGRPGEGKTTLARAIAEHLDMPVHVFDLASMNDSDFAQSWELSAQASPRIALFEDFDAVFDGRENVKQRDLSFDTILNAVDGIEQENGLLLFVTTNHLDKIDPALGTSLNGTEKSTRPGRINMVCKIGGLSYEGLYKIAFRILQDKTEAQKLAVDNPDATGDQIQDMAISRALALLWGED